MGCQVLETEKWQTFFKKGQIFYLTIETSIYLKKANYYLINFQNFRCKLILKKAKFGFFGLEKAQTWQLCL